MLKHDRQRSPPGYSGTAGSSIVYSVPSMEDGVAELAARDVPLLQESTLYGPLGRYVAFVDPFGVVPE